MPVTMMSRGRKSLTIKELLSLTPGAVVSFDRSVTEPMDIMINGTLVARGEIVSADGKWIAPGRCRQSARALRAIS